jgi:hypothetical protein
MGRERSPKSENVFVFTMSVVNASFPNNPEAFGNMPKIPMEPVNVFGSAMILLAAHEI